MTPAEVVNLLDAGLGAMALWQLRAVLMELRTLDRRVSHVEALTAQAPALVRAPVAS